MNFLLTLTFPLNCRNRALQSFPAIPFQVLYFVVWCVRQFLRVVSLSGVDGEQRCEVGRCTLQIKNVLPKSHYKLQSRNSTHHHNQPCSSASPRVQSSPSAPPPKLLFCPAPWPAPSILTSGRRCRCPCCVVVVVEGSLRNGSPDQQHVDDDGGKQKGNTHAN